jgi:hypothetical protein
LLSRANLSGNDWKQGQKLLESPYLVKRTSYFPSPVDREESQETPCLECYLRLPRISEESYHGSENRVVLLLCRESYLVSGLAVKEGLKLKLCSPLEYWTHSLAQMGPFHTLAAAILYTELESNENINRYSM